MRHLLTVLIGAVLLAATLTLAGPQPRAGAAPGVGADASPAPQDLSWSACTDIADAECAGIDVPVDFARPVDLITPSAVKNPYFRDAMNGSREQIYAS